jgi:hypothetical protein
MGSCDDGDRHHDARKRRSVAIVLTGMSDARRGSPVEIVLFNDIGGGSL